MTIADIASRLQQGEKLCISFDGWMDDEGHQKWTSPLSDAQMFAYWNHKIIHWRVDDFSKTIYCMIATEIEG